MLQSKGPFDLKSTSISSDFARSFFTWSQHLREELDFWSHWAASGGAPNPAHHAERTNPSMPVDSRIIQYAQSRNLKAITVLDVGSGPLTKVGHLGPDGLSVKVIASDPLAQFYNEEFKKHRIQVPNPPEFALAEFLSSFYPHSSIDVISCNNALDHCIDPVRAIYEMLIILKVGGVALCSSRRNEGANANYEGLHQFNIDSRGGEVFIAGRDQPLLPLRQQLPEQCTIRLTSEDADWVHFRVEKNDELLDGKLVEHLRLQLRELLQGAVDAGLQQASECSHEGECQPIPRGKRRLVQWIKNVLRPTP